MAGGAEVPAIPSSRLEAYLAEMLNRGIGSGTGGGSQGDSGAGTGSEADNNDNLATWDDMQGILDGLWADDNP